MLTKRIIPCLDIKNGRTVKGVNFVDLRDAGDAIELAKRYEQEGADELVFLDITATNERRKTAAGFATEVGRVLSIPFTIGGGIASVEDAREVLSAGADKIGVNSAAVKNHALISELSDALGAQAVVLAVDAKKKEEGRWEVFVGGGKIATGLDVLEWVREGEKRGAGEILLTSMDADGVKTGFDIALTKAVCEVVSLPVIASGGAGKPEHFQEVFQETEATGGLAASIFHFQEVEISELKSFLREKEIAVRETF